MWCWLRHRLRPEPRLLRHPWRPPRRDTARSLRPQQRGTGWPNPVEAAPARVTAAGVTSAAVGVTETRLQASQHAGSSTPTESPLQTQSLPAQTRPGAVRQRLHSGLATCRQPQAPERRRHHRRRHHAEGREHASPHRQRPQHLSRHVRFAENPRQPLLPADDQHVEAAAATVTATATATDKATATATVGSPWAMIDLRRHSLQPSGWKATMACCERHVAARETMQGQ